MTQKIIDLLIPILQPMGVSVSDVESYVTMCEKYIYAILIATAVMLVLLILAHWLAKKGSRHAVRWTAFFAWLAAIGIIANMVVFGPLKNNLSQQFAPKVELNEETLEGSKSAIQAVGEQGMVLVKNEGLLPLSADVKKINVFGWDSISPVLGGTGSGASDGSTAVTILQSLADASYETNKDVTAVYEGWTTTRPGTSMQVQDWSLPEPPVERYSEDLLAAAKDFSDVAIFCIGRSGGEGADLPKDMNAVIKGTYDLANDPAQVTPEATASYNYTRAKYVNNSGSYADFDEGMHYLELSNTERKVLDMVTQNFENVIVLVNANNAMELGFVDEYPQIKAVILAPGTGTYGMTALGEILNGSINPSGKTADTFVKDLTRTPTWNNFGHNGFTGDKVAQLRAEIRTADRAFEGTMGFVNYVEGIYVGYKFYETAAEEGLITYEDEVQYPFGFGLSYTTFEKKITSFEKTDDAIKMTVSVKNTGNVAGRDVVEVYFTPPYTDGGIEKASVNLIDFEKTVSLEPDGTQPVMFEIPLEDMASYDSEGIKVAGGGYILEAGEYKISVRSDSHTVVDEKSFTVDSDIIYSDGRSSDLTAPVNHFDYAKGKATYLSRQGGFANYAEATAAPAEELFTMDDETFEIVKEGSSAYYDASKYEDASAVMPTQGASNGLTVADLAGAAYDDERWEQLLDQMTPEEMVQLINVGGWQTVPVESIGKVGTSDCDGPAGLSNFITQNYGTAFPVEILMAQTWSKDLAKQMGENMSEEYKAANNFGWYGPAMNNHRNAFAGRNFEYFSEDGVLAGKFALAEIEGAASNGVYAYIKHFCLNDQETDRCSFLLTYSNEQAIREIYMKPFEIVVKGFDDTKSGIGVMSSFNFIGPVAACENPELLKTVLRDEWGFKGMVITDYNGSYGYMHTDAAIRNGGDLMLGFGRNATNALNTESATVVINMRNACHNILYTIANSGYYRASGYSAEGGGSFEITDTASGLDIMNQLFSKVNFIGGAVILFLWLCIMIRWLNRKKKGLIA